MVKKALCVGCNYPSKAFGLAGGVHDAFLLADCLQQHCGFDQENISILHDVYPGQKKSMTVDPSRTPSRVNILNHLQWLVRNAKPGDVLFFSFSGYGLQVDDMDGYQDEGYDEAILPTDFVDGRDGDYTVIVADDIHDILMGVPQDCAVIVIMDCDHASSIIDVSGTLDGKLVNGLKLNNFCGLKGHTVKMQLAAHNRDVWQEEKARAVKARPRFQPMMEIDNPRRGRLPTRPSMSRSTPVAFCFSAAGHGQTALEMQVTTIADGKETQKQHGILSWSFVRALEELKYDCTYMDLLMGVRRQYHSIKERDLPRLDQEVLLTYCAPLSNPSTMRAMAPVNMQQCRQASRGLSEPGQIPPTPFAVPAVVPPPAPGVVAGQGQGASTPSAPERTGPPPPVPIGRGTSCGTTASATPPELEGADGWPPLPPPPPPVPTAPPRCTSQLVHHKLAPGEGGSFSVQGGVGVPAPVRGAREPWREPSFEAGCHTTGRPEASPSTPIMAREPPGQVPPERRPSASSAAEVVGHHMQRPLQTPPARVVAEPPPADVKLEEAAHPDFSAFGFFGNPLALPPGMPQTAPGALPLGQSPMPSATFKVPGLTPPNLFAGGAQPNLGGFSPNFTQLGAAAMAGLRGPHAVTPHRWQ